MPLKSVAPLLAVLVAIALPLALGIKAHRAQRAGDEIRVAIEAYDPRDLLHGRYLTFRLRWDLPEDRAAMAAPACLCIGAAADATLPAPVSVMACGPARDGGNCGSVLSGRDGGGTFFDIGIDRYYVDERYALALERLIRDAENPASFAIGLVPQTDGTAVIRNLYVDGRPLAAYLRDHGAALLSR